MLNLQVCSPYKKCPYKCPMCVVDNTKQSQYNNLYEVNPQLYYDLLQVQVKHHHKDIILTGSTEPTLFPQWLHETIDFLYDINCNVIELQTKNYRNPFNRYRSDKNKITTLCYSVTSANDFYDVDNLIMIPNNNRLTILLTKDIVNLELQYFLKKVKRFNQITFKVLQYTTDQSINKYIDDNKANNLSYTQLLTEMLNTYGISTRIDYNCQTATNRYDIFRIDGNIYHEW